MQITKEEGVLLNAGKVNDAIKLVMKRVPCGEPQAAAIIHRVLQIVELEVIENEPDYILYANGWRLHRLVA